MGYLFRKLTGKKRQWKIQYQKQSKGKVKINDIKVVEYSTLGIHSDMSIDEIRDKIKQLNAQAELKRRQEGKLLVQERLAGDELQINASFPQYLLDEFEDTYINIRTKDVSYWRTAKKLIIEVGLPVKDWEFDKFKWYYAFKKHKYSYDYVQKLLYKLNQWGRFVSYKSQSFFAPIPAPRGLIKQQLIETYETSKKTFNYSNPLTPEKLEAGASQFSTKAYNWLYLSIWLGLRPLEIDSLHKPSGPKTWIIGDGVIRVYQTKLVGIPTKERIKVIPIKYPEQKKCLEIIHSQQFKRPLTKTLIRVFNEHITCYGGRKGFFDLMFPLGNSIEAISAWLGHRSLDRTWKSYKDKEKVLWK